MSHYAKMKKAVCGTSADGREDPRKGEKDIKDSIAQGRERKVARGEGAADHRAAQAGEELQGDCAGNRSGHEHGVHGAPEART